jgi:hypothetical protein
LFVFNLGTRTLRSLVDEIVYVVAEVVLVDAVAQSDGFIVAVDFHCATPARGAAKHLGGLAGAGMQLLRSAVIKGSGHTIAAQSDSASDARANIGMAQQLSGSLRRHRSSQPMEADTARGTGRLITQRSLCRKFTNRHTVLEAQAVKFDAVLAECDS